MNAVALIAIWAWAPLVAAMFAVMPARRAVLVAVIGGWLLLPMVELHFPGMPNYGKTAATAAGALAGVLLFDAGRLVNFRLRLIDMAAIGVTVAPMLSSLSNGLGAYDGVSAMVPGVHRWLIPYFLGRLYFSDLEGVRELAVAVFIGGLVYVPLCLYEIRMSPQLHTMLYGFHQHDFRQSIRFGGYRPVVFMQHGLGVGMWMTAASLVGVWLWRTGALRAVMGVPASWLLGGLLMTTLLCKSFGSLALLVMGLAALEATRQARTVVLVAALAVLPLAYMGLRMTGSWSGQNLVEASQAIAGEDRAWSLAFRIRMEDILVDRALERPVFGWGGWGRNRPEGQGDRVVTDGMWVISLGQNGVVGLMFLVATILGPAVIFLRRVPARWWYHPSLAPAGALAVLLVLFMLDSLLNAVPNPVFVLAAGGVAGVGAGLGRARPLAAAGPQRLGVERR